MRIELEDLVLRYGDVTALDGITLTLEEGKIYGLLGRNGSGKTSLMSVLAAFRKQTSGQVRIDGEPVFENARVTSRISLTRETGETVTIGTGEEALSYAEVLRPNWDGEFARSLLDLFKINPKMSVKNMSRGQRSAMGIVVGLASRAPLTMFDEAHLGLDAPSRQLFYEQLLADYLAHPRTIIMSTHLIDEVSWLFEEVVIIHQGRLVIHEERDTLLSKGTSVTGPAALVDGFTAGMQVLGSRSLGPTKSVTVYGELDDARRRKAQESGLELGPVPLQDLFTHLTADGAS
ncbi:ATP-binding cassette domain-containing protein [Thermobispora bispora]|uniref:ABC transporter related protein n=1 Tax=Thermobispora bispora (strain ATCC 19993 / DSM 43833 / CBS 139.67 / JCM 10125 / KCTC 9307 / NBRC 14880 / R51) TaxID=469371 RepID=D6Y8M9_THEBD|nr:ABC transporter ATP-binding protein [Thermobispora bispora]ADG87926.1 ABC transporter related protein [Thermobispora bispora DSM 43833]MBO2473811.1 ABC transporter ATP-binding protein [Actinomycetales bacterium]MBX6167724.1 ABC transporter ATP-binding protein [Thermobispora bispora]QSI47804.1 ABC transporter ATP-binding protein [Thermobispora bispora]